MSKNKENKWKELAEEGADEETLPGSELPESPVELSQSPEPLDFPSHKDLEDKLTQKEREADAYREKLFRLQADMENLRKRTEREVANAIKFGNERLVQDLLPVLDSLMRGLESPDSNDPHVKNMREGISLTLDLLHKMLITHGVQLIDPKPGDVFNPAFHEAVSLQKIPGAKPNTIAQVMQKGYQLNDRVLRPAIVVVAS